MARLIVPALVSRRAVPAILRKEPLGAAATLLGREEIVTMVQDQAADDHLFASDAAN